MLPKQMVSLDDITAIEDRYVVGGLPTLGDAHAALLASWRNQEANREVCLRLMFLTWYSCSEPNSLTGLPGDTDTDLFRSLFAHLGGEETLDREVMFAVGVMGSTFPYCCGDEGTWKPIATTLRRRYQELSESERLQPGDFQGRGAYGSYFSHMLAVGSSSATTSE
jgi:hypothetical protein